ncbi:VanZ family protein [Streptomyces longispororuber]|uniref:VanZ family protein n=1 Tax=Streptomyces longispororuber TaxID=68230 RepID=UPI00167CECEE|nr:VanZ family protein [Streptomyces longispororuber]
MTWFFPGAGGSSTTCVLNKDLAEPFKTEQGLLNAGMFAPLGFFGLLASRRVLATAAWVVAAPVAIEVGQAVLPWVGRNCDSSDAEMNILGGVSGALVAWLGTYIAKARLQPVQPQVRPTLLSAGATLVVCAVTWQVAITPIAVDATSLQSPDDAQKQAATDAFRTAFGDRYTFANVQLQPGPDGHDSLLITLERDGEATLSWPKTDRFNVSLESSSQPGPNSYPVGGSSRRDVDATEAYAIARRYAGEHYPWALRGSTHRTYPVGENAEFGWMTSWRFLQDGVVMPAKLDVEINRAGRVSQLNVDSGPPHVKLPPIKLTRQQAVARARATQTTLDGVSVKARRLAAYEVRGHWRAQWVVAIIPEGSDPSSVLVDATTGRVDDSGPDG